MPLSSSMLAIAPSRVGRTQTMARRSTAAQTLFAEILADLAGYPPVLVVADMASIFRISEGRVRADAPTGSNRIPPGWRNGPNGQWRWFKRSVARFLLQLERKSSPRRRV